MEEKKFDPYQFIGFVLMALYNVQEHIENPFDGQGMDDLDFEAIQMNEYEQLG